MTRRRLITLRGGRSIGRRFNSRVIESMRLIERAEADLGYRLADGECRDLLKDHKLWPDAIVASIVEEVRARQRALGREPRG